MPYTDPHDASVDENDETPLVKQLRKQLQEKDKVIKGLETKVESTRSETIANALKDAGVSEKVAKYIPEDLDATKDSVLKWLEEEGDVFGVKPAKGEPADADEDEADDGESGTQVADEQVDAIKRVQRAQGAGTTGAKAVGSDKTLADLKVVAGQGSDALFDTLRAQGYLAN